MSIFAEKAEGVTIATHTWLWLLLLKDKLKVFIRHDNASAFSACIFPVTVWVQFCPHFGKSKHVNGDADLFLYGVRE